MSRTVPAPLHEGRLPLLAGQSGIWFDLQLGTPAQHYDVGLYTDICGPLDIPDLQAAARRTVAEAEALRVRFVDGDGAEDGAGGSGPGQVVEGPVETWDLPVVDVADEDAARAWMRNELATPLDVRTGRLFTFALIRVAPDRHLFYQRAHHLALDGHSGALLLRRTAEIYTALREGRDPAEGTLPPLAELHAAEAEYRASQRFAADRAYWAERLAGRPEPAALSGAGTGTGHGDQGRDDLLRSAGRISQESLDRLAATARLARTNWSTALIAAIAAYLHRMTGQDDLLLSLPVANRATAVAKRTPGMTANILPLRVRADRGTTVHAFIRRALDETRQTLCHQQYRYEELLRDLRNSGAGGVAQQFGPMVNIMGFDLDISFAGTVGHAHRLTSGFIEDMEFAACPVPGEGGFQLQLAANPDRYTQAGLDDHLNRFAAFLDSFAASPDTTLGDLPVFLPGERGRLVEGWNRTGVEVVPGTLSGLFSGRVAVGPDVVAVREGGVDVSYAELEVRANRVARFLIGRGVCPGDVVGVVLPRSVDLVVALLGVLKAGAAYLPVDVGYPVERREFMLADAGVVCVVDASVVAEAEGVGCPVGDPGVVVDPWSAAYVMYTSGSTGRPKGVVVPHAGVVNRLAWMQNEYRLSVSERVLQKTPVGFDVSVWEIFWTLTQGGTLVLAEPEGHRDPAYLVRLIERERITTVHFVPSMLQEFLREPDVAKRCGSLRRVVCSGEALPAETVEAFFGVLPGVELHNLYGPTEASIDVTYAELVPGSGTSVVPIGRPVWNTRVYVLDGDLRPVPAGVSGELYLAGVQLAWGYVGRPGLTAAAFVPDPFGPAGSRMHRTGDLAAWTVRGELVHLGRTDDQVKIRGQRVELGEIQAVLAEVSGVVQAAVVVRGERIVGYVVVQPGAVVDTSLLARRLPGHMVPSVFVEVAELPLTPNGKLDRKALPEPEVVAVGGGRAPRTPREEILCGLFAEVLGMEQAVGVDDDFFALGGHSLLATRLVSRVRAVLGVEMPLRAIFDAPRVSALAELIGQAGQAAGRRRPPVFAQERPATLPLSYAQRRLWFLDRMEGGGATYNMPLAVRLNGLLDTRALEIALRDVVARHESLRTVFRDQDGDPVQEVLDAAAARPRLLREDTTEEDLAERLAAATARPFDLSRQLPLRTVLFTISPVEHVLLLVLHRIAGDGWSFAPLGADLSAAYQRRVFRGEPQCEPLPVQYADYTLWQHALLGEEGDPDSLAARQLDYWRGELAALPVELVLPADRARPAVAGYEGGLAAWRVDAQLRKRLDGLARDAGASLFMVVQAGLAALLSRLGAGEDIPIGAPVAGRTDVALDDLVGFFVNTLVLRTDVSGRPSFRELVERVRDSDLRAFEHQDVPFERLVEVLNPERSLGRHPLFQVALNFQNNADAGLDLPHVVATTEPVHGLTAQFDLSFTVRDAADGGLDGHIEFARDLFDQATVDILGERLVRLLRAAVEQPERPLEEHQLLSEQEWVRVLEEWNDTAVELSPATVHGLFETQVATTPARIALVYGDEQLTYAELNARANRLAHRLIAQGAGPHTVVAVSLPRSMELVVALLAVMKSGAAYLPVDPEYPAERIAFMLDDVKCVARVTEPEDVRDPGPWPDSNPARVASAARMPAYVIYTSGSTGRPKGVVVRHDAVAGYLSYLHDLTGLGRDDIVLNLASVSFDPSVRDVFGPLTAGARLVVAEPEQAKDPAALFGLLLRHRVTVLPALVPTMLNALADAAQDAAAAEGGPSPWLRTGLVSGEELTAAHVRRAAAIGSGWDLVNQYGPTESTMTATFHPVAPGDAREDGARMPIGRPAPNGRCYVLDPWLRPVPPGTTGELYLAGDDLADGYANRPALTAERFLADPYGTRPGARMYRTGDLARWRGDGSLEFHGRADDQVKFRGVRVELGEIQVALGGLPGVAQAAVAVREDTPGRQTLVGYVVGAGAGRPDVDLLRGALADRLPATMVPSAYVVLDALPLSPNGKIDRGALPAPEPAATGGREPGTPVEKEIAEVFRDVLDLEQVGAEDNFFALGGHSLTAARLVGRIKAVLGVDLPLRSLFQAPTVAALAALVERDGDGSLDVLLPIRPGGTGVPLFCIHPVGGLSWCYARLVPYIDEAHPVYGLQARGIAAHHDERPRTIEEMADQYVTEIRRVQPHGPYQLLGWSVGGNVAHAVAVRLRRLGEPVALVALLDSCPSDLMDKPTPALERERLHKVVAGFEDGAPGIESDDDGSEISAVLRKELSVMKGMSRDQIGAMWDTSVNTSLILRDYVPEPLDTGLVYFTALLERPEGSPDVTAWEPYSGGPIEEYPIASSHAGMMDAGPVAEIGRILGAVLRRIRRDGGIR